MRLSRFPKKLAFLFLTGAILFFFPVTVLSSTELTRTEKNYLRKKETIVFVSQTRYPPFEFVNEHGEHTGMCIELARWIATEQGFKPRFTDTSFNEAQEAILSGKADILTSFFYSEKRDRTFDFTETMFEVPASIFVAADRPDIKELEDLQGKRIAMQKGDYAKEFLESKKISFDVINTKNFAEATNLVIEGKADAIIGDEQIVLYHIYKNGLTDKVKKVAEPLYIGKNCMASMEGNTILIGILNKGIKLARESGTLEKISRKWLGTRFTLRESLLFKYLPHFSVAAGLIVVLALLTWFWNIRLHQEVNKRTMDLRQSEERFRAIFNAANDAILLLDLDTGTILDVNSKACEMMGYSREGFQGLEPGGLSSGETPYSQERALAYLKKAAEDEPQLVEWRMKDKNGRQFWVEINMKKAFIGDNPQILMVVRDIDERKTAEEILRSSEERFRSLVEDAPVGISIMKADETFEYFNPKFVEMFGYTIQDIPDKASWFEKAYPDKDYREKVIQTWKDDIAQGVNISEPEPRSFTVRTKDGSEKTVTFRGVGLKDGKQLLISEDITERQRLQKLLEHAQKMESIGTLTSGVSHNFRNILAGISVNNQLMEMLFKDNQRLQEIAQRIDTFVDRGSRLVEHLMQFSHKKAREDFKLTDVAQLLQDTYQLISKSFDKSIEIRTEIPDTLPVMGDPSGLSQVFMNLCTNARDAIYAKSHGLNISPPGGKLDIKGKQERDNIVVTISDTGKGMDKQEQDQCFDPFYTTKEEGTGTGLGLSTSYGIINDHNGEIRLYSEPGKGTTFKIILPSAREWLEAEGDNNQEIVRGKGEKILIVDDEREIRLSAMELLASMGYDCDCAEDGEQGFQKYKSWGPDIVLLDRNMPGMDGITCAKMIMEYDPSAKIVFLSGYRKDGSNGINDKTKEIIKEYITKPVDMAELSTLLARLLS